MLRVTNSQRLHPFHQTQAPRKGIGAAQIFAIFCSDTITLFSHQPDARPILRRNVCRIFRAGLDRHSCAGVACRSHSLRRRTCAFELFSCRPVYSPWPAERCPLSSSRRRVYNPTRRVSHSRRCRAHRQSPRRLLRRVHRGSTSPCHPRRADRPRHRCPQNRPRRRKRPSKNC